MKFGQTCLMSTWKIRESLRPNARTERTALPENNAGVFLYLGNVNVQSHQTFVADGVLRAMGWERTGSKAALAEALGALAEKVEDQVVVGKLVPAEWSALLNGAREALEGV